MGVARGGECEAGACCCSVGLWMDYALMMTMILVSLLQRTCLGDVGVGVGGAAAAAAPVFFFFLSSFPLVRKGGLGALI